MNIRFDIVENNHTIYYKIQYLNFADVNKKYNLMLLKIENQCVNDKPY